MVKQNRTLKRNKSTNETFLQRKNQKYVGPYDEFDQEYLEEKLENNDDLAKIEQDRLAKEKAEQDRLAKEKAEQERLAKEKAEQDRLAKEKAELERIAKEKAEQDRLAKEKAEQERLAKEEAEARRLAALAELEALKREQVTVQEAHNEIKDDVAEALIEQEEETEKIYGNKKGIINLDIISKNFESGDTVTVNILKEKKLIDQNINFIKVLARGVLDKPLTIKAQDFSLDAAKMIQLTGGHVVMLTKRKYFN